MDIGGVVHAFFDNAGPGGVFALLVVGAACAIYYFLTRWIVTATHDPTNPDPNFDYPCSLDSGCFDCFRFFSRPSTGSG